MLDIRCLCTSLSIHAPRVRVRALAGSETLHKYAAFGNSYVQVSVFIFVLPTLYTSEVFFMIRDNCSPVLCLTPPLKCLQFVITAWHSPDCLLFKPALK